MNLKKPHIFESISRKSCYICPRQGEKSLGKGALALSAFIQIPAKYLFFKRLRREMLSFSVVYAGLLLSFAASPITTRWRDDVSSMVLLNGPLGGGFG